MNSNKQDLEMDKILLEEEVLLEDLEDSGAKPATKICLEILNLSLTWEDKEQELEKELTFMLQLMLVSWTL